MNVRQYQRKWEARERIYTNRYARQFFRLLNSIWKRSAKQYEETGTFSITEDDFLPTYRRLYDRITLSEAKIVVEQIEKETKTTKDIFDALAQLFTGSLGDETVRFVSNLMQQYFDVYVMQRLREVSENTRAQIQFSLQQGIEQGLPARDIARLITRRAPEVNRTRAVRIARTEAVTAANRAQLLSHEASPFVYEKSWLPVVDNRTRPAHIAMNPRNFIALWDNFIVGGEEMIAPGDATASAGNVINCRCSMLYQLKRGENGRPIRKNTLQV